MSSIKIIKNSYSENEKVDEDYYYSKVLAQLSAIFYCAGYPRDTCINDIMYLIIINDNYDTELDALEAYNNYVARNKAKSFKHIFQMQLERNLIEDWTHSKNHIKQIGFGI